MSNFKRKSEKILSVFSKTVEELTKINEKVVEKARGIEIAIDEMAFEKEELNDLRESNSRVISRINGLID